MTPLDKTLVDQMKTALSKSAPDVSKWIATFSRDVAQLGSDVSAHNNNGSCITLIAGQNMIHLNPETFKALLRFSEQIGWQCD